MQSTYGDKLNPTQRKSIGVNEPYVRREKLEGEALANIINNAHIKETYTPGDGDMPIVIRPGALRFLDLPSV